MFCPETPHPWFCWFRKLLLHNPLSSPPLSHLSRQEGETLPLKNPVHLMTPDNKHPLDVEAWMIELDKQMKVAVRETVTSCLEAFHQQARDEWLLGWTAQSLLLSSAILWCQDVSKVYKVRF